jgi:acyl carrier protein
VYLFVNNPDSARALTQPEIAALVIASLREVLDMTPNRTPVPEALDGETHLIGPGAVLDSMGLVTLILEIEQRLEAEHGLTLVLADERAMSQKNSPFRSVQSLTDYVVGQVGALSGAED